MTANIVEGGLLNDDQIQTIGRMTLEEAQAAQYRQIVVFGRKS